MWSVLYIYIYDIHILKIKRCGYQCVRYQSFMQSIFTQIHIHAYVQMLAYLWGLNFHKIMWASMNSGYIFFYFIAFFFFFFFFFFLGPHLGHVEVPRLEVRSELQLQGYATATATPDLRCISKLPHRSWQRQIVNPLREARDLTGILMDTSWVRFWWVIRGTPWLPSKVI